MLKPKLLLSVRKFQVNLVKPLQLVFASVKLRIGFGPNKLQTKLTKEEGKETIDFTNATNANEVKFQGRSKS